MKNELKTKKDSLIRRLVVSLTNKKKPSSIELGKSNIIRVSLRSQLHYTETHDPERRLCNYSRKQTVHCTERKHGCFGLKYREIYLKNMTTSWLLYSIALYTHVNITAPENKKSKNKKHCMFFCVKCYGTLGFKIKFKKNTL